MADVDAKITIKTPTKAYQDITFQSLSANDVFVIPYRFPYGDIVNATALKADGKLRNSSTTVGKYGGGYQLPQTEKLILLAKLGTADATTLTFTGNKFKGIPNKTVEIPAGSVGDLLEIDLYDFGLLLTEEGEVKIKTDKALSVALIARH
jgi:hypothetical protein